MKKLMLVFLAFLAILASPSFAILGLGAHWAPSTHSIERNVDTLSIAPPEAGDVKFVQGHVSDMQGFGFKFWIDILPIIDVETSLNFNFGRYSADLRLNPPNAPSQTIDVNPQFDFAGLEVPNYFQTNWDLSVNYPIADLIPMVTPYVGAGFSYFAGTPVADKEFVTGIIEANPSILDPTAEDFDPQALGENLADQLVDGGFNSAVGGHAILGVRIKPVILPFAVYANTKYYFADLGPTIQQGAAFELGGGIAF